MTDEIEIAMRKIEHAGAYCSWDTPGTHLDSHKGSSTTEKGTNQAIHLGDELASSLGSGAPHGMMFPLQASPPGLRTDVSQAGVPFVPLWHLNVVTKGPLAKLMQVPQPDMTKTLPTLTVGTGSLERRGRNRGGG